MREVRIGVVPGDSPFADQFAEADPVHLGEFGGLSERQNSLRIEREGQFGADALLDFVLGRRIPWSTESGICSVIPMTPPYRCSPT